MGKLFLGLIAIIFISNKVHSQAQLQPWGNMAGIKIEGQLLPFETSIQVIGKNRNFVKATGKEKQRPHFTRNGNQQIVTTNIDSIYFTEKVEDVGRGNIKMIVSLTAKADEELEGIFLCLSLPENFNINGTMQVDKKPQRQLSAGAKALNSDLNLVEHNLDFVSPTLKLGISLSKPTQLYSDISKQKGEKTPAINIYFPLHKGNISNGLSLSDTLFISADGVIDKKPISIEIDASKPGNTFDGFGGNFRLQNPTADPMVIDYCLKNMRVAWSRVEMPWRFWQPVKDTDPIAAAKSGQLDPAVQKAMEMAQRLGKMNIPFILSAWSGPAWAVVGTPKFSAGADGIWGNPLNKDSLQQTYKSIADYIVYLKDNYGVAPIAFSFNESDLGINIRQTGEEHLDLIKGLGAYFVQRGIKTKLLLGDNSDATSYKFVYPALNDTAAYPFISAVSFHSWRGCDRETLLKWAAVAAKINKPLLVAEGSIDAQAWGYPAVFKEAFYALQEIDLYIRLLATCQPQSILQWQLTSDYSPLIGGGIFGNNEPLKPTQRFYNLKQLAATPKDLKALPVVVRGAAVSCAALGNAAKKQYVIHIVNSGSARMVNLKGLPINCGSLKIVVTNKQINIEPGKLIKVVEGKATFKISADSFISLSN